MNNKIFITGAGIATEAIPNVSVLRNKNIDELPLMQPATVTEEFFTRPKAFKSASNISREDRSLLNIISQLAIDATTQAFELSENQYPFSAEERVDFPIFIANDAAEHNLNSLDNFLFDNEVNVKGCLNKLGEIKKYLNPLDMLRLLSTNPTYHISKVFKLQGGGYPIKRMSLSGLIALQESQQQLQSNKFRAVVVGVGDITNPENLCAFLKMGLLRTSENNVGILPSYGAAALILERENKHNSKSDQNNQRSQNSNLSKRYLAEVQAIDSIYKNDTVVSKSDWMQLHRSMKEKIDLNQPHIVLYDNGVESLAIAERQAISEIYENSPLYSYKKYVGYTGKANNLVDLVLSLADKRIPVGSNIVINGIGTSCGFGSIAIKKLDHL